jgi:hypothetical protein
LDLQKRPSKKKPLKTSALKATSKAKARR